MGLRARRQAVQLQLRRDEVRGRLRVRARAGAATVDARRDVVDLLAVLFDDNRSSSCSGISCKDNTLTEFDPDDGCSCLFV